MKKLIFLPMLLIIGCTTTSESIFKQEDLLKEIQFLDQDKINLDIEKFELVSTDCYIYTLTGKTRDEILKSSGVVSGTAVSIAVLKGTQRAIIDSAGQTIGRTSSGVGASLAASALVIAVPYFVDLAKDDLPDEKQKLATSMSLCLSKSGYDNRLINMWRPDET